MNLKEQLQELVQNGILTTQQVPNADNGDLIYTYTPTGTPVLRTVWGIHKVRGVFLDSPTPMATIFPWVVNKNQTSVGPGELAEALYYKHNPPNPLFKNGKVREGYIHNLIVRFNHEKIANWIESQRRYKELESLWDKLSTQQKELIQESGLATVSTSGEVSFNWNRQTLLIISEGTQGHQIGKIFHGRVLAEDYTKSELASYIQGLPVYKQKTTEPEYVIRAFGTNFNVTSAEIGLLKYRGFAQCSQCGSWENKDKMTFSVCNSCVPVPELRSYSDKATAHFHIATGKGKFSQHLLGVELEYELTGKHSRKETLFLLQKSIGDHAIFKRDGSLTNGIEICTRPADANVHLDSFVKMWEDSRVFDALSVQHTCGMHVHVDRRNMTSLTLGKLVAFIHSKHNKDFLISIAGRENSRYASLGANDAVTSVVYGTVFDNRYKALNLTNTNTAEIRIFKTPSTYEDLAKNIEFVEALRTFVLPANSGIKEQDWEHFVSFVRSNSKTYKELNKFLKNTWE